MARGSYIPWLVSWFLDLDKLVVVWVVFDG